MIEFENVRFAYPDGVAALTGVDFRLGRGEFVALVGPNGSGKTTLARIVAHKSKSRFVPYSAVTAGVKEIKEEPDQY